MMEHRRYEPPGYLSKKAAAERLGISTKTLDRRMKTEPKLWRVLRKGRQIFLPVEDVEAYFHHGQQRGYI